MRRFWRILAAAGLGLFVVRIMGGDGLEYRKALLVVALSTTVCAAVLEWMEGHK